MASGFFAILDDIAALMDDIAVTSKVATKQTAGILGDDLAVNAEKATGFLSSREIPVLLQIMKGSFINKLIIVPIAFLLQWMYPPAIKIILVLGGLYLAFEGVEKMIEYFFHKKEESGKEVIEEIEAPGTSGEAEEKSKVKSAITTDFILSIEIVIIALGTVLKEPLMVQIITVSIVSIIATVGVYGIVALIVRMDDAGFKLIKKSGQKGFLNTLGEFLVKALPWVIKALGVIGTVALILVAGGIFDHNIDYLHHLLPNVPSMLKQAIYGIVGGLVMLPVFILFKRAFKFVKKAN
ncbi:Inner membrane protein yedI [Chryseobacterium taklimakanense]|uniref:Inner membrane protein yedI n=1 Tax=Chryseobacterium taklimakanense TaxID=536441 RepID=A0A239XWD6_9FLAO|nr:DUF808 family protein [Chryseobacterium taklimakanense]SNV51301.1 Inner membrane protein yedI [Chryseobacterium taklimakanense]